MWRRLTTCPRRRAFKSVPICVCLMAVSPADASDWFSTAPPPDPAAPVDYVAWLDAVLLPTEAQKAARVYSSATQLLTRIEDERTLDRHTIAPWQDVPVIETWLRSNIEPLAKFRQAAQLDSSYLGLQPANDETADARWRDALHLAIVPDLGAFRVGVKGLLASGWSRWAAGEEAPLIDDALRCVAIGHHLESEASMIARYVSLTVLEHTYQALLSAASRSSHRHALAHSLAIRLSGIDPPLVSLGEAYRLEHLTSWDVLQRMYEPGDEPGTWRVVPSAEGVYRELASLAGEKPAPWEDVRSSVAKLGYDGSLCEIDAFFTELLKWNDEHYHLAARRTDAIDKMADELSNPVVRLLVFRATMARQKLTRVIGLQRGIHLALRIIRYHSQKKRFPETLDDLSGSAVMQPWRTDPYTGRDYVYARTRDSFVLYSIGPDLKDDAGRPYLPATEKGDLNIWPVGR